MADEKIELREINYRQILPWTELFKGFQLALDPKKLLLAAAGIVVMSFGWSVLSWAFYKSRDEPTLSRYPLPDYMKLVKLTEEEEKLPESEREKIREQKADKLRAAEFEREYYKWQLLYETAGPGGRFSTLPWFEKRGPNPYLWITGQSGAPGLGSSWRFFRKEARVLLEPLYKFLSPVIYLLKPAAGFWNHVYFTLILLWTLATWALFGGAITRMAAVQLARKEKISIVEALKFTRARYVSFFSAPLFPLVFVLVVVVFLVVYGWLHLIPIVGDIIVDGIFWPLPLLAGLVMAVILVGLLGWPLMYATISTEGSDSFDALSRSYSYVYQAPWHYIWNSLVAVVYGAIVVFFVGFMGSLAVYLAKWGVSQAPGLEMANREPSYLFVYAPTSFGWRELLLKGGQADISGALADETRYYEYLAKLKLYNHVGAVLVGIWLYLAFLLVVGFAYSYFWSAGTIIYLLMRRHVDDTELDEIYIDEDEAEEAYSSPPMTSTPTPSPAGTTPLAVVEPPVLKPAGAATAAAAPTPAGTETASPNGGAGKSTGES